MTHSPYLRCHDCLRRASPGPNCVHRTKCLEIGWIGRALAYLLGWPFGLSGRT